MSNTETEAAQAEQTSRVFTQEEVSAIAAKEAAKARDKATSNFVSELGFNDPDEVKNAVTAFKEYQEKQKSAEQRLQELEQERGKLSEKSQKYEATVNQLLDQELAQVPEDRRSLIPEIDDPVVKLSYISKNKQFLVGTPAPVSVGAQTAPAAPVEQPPMTFEEFKKLSPSDLAAFHKDYPSTARDYSERLRQGH